MKVQSSKYLRYFLKMLGIVSFIGVCSIALFFAFGYQPDLSFRQIKKTSIVHVTPRFKDVKDVKVFLGDKLYAEELPAQMKGVLPDTYLLLVESPRFFPWKKELLVENDFVTKVEDVLLFPRDMEPFTKTLRTFIEDVQFVWTKNSFVVFRPDQDYITIGRFFPDGILQQQEVKLFSDQISAVSALEDGTIWVQFKDSEISEVIFPEGDSTIRLRLPQGVSRLTFDRDRQYAFFLFHNDLWKVPRSSLENFDLARDLDFRVLVSVEQFSLSDDSLYFLTDGELRMATLEGKDARVFDPGPFSNLSFAQFGSEGYLVLRMCSHESCPSPNRKLYRFDAEGNFTLLTTFLSGDFLANDRGEIVYMNENREVYLYSSLLDTSKMILKSATPLKLLTLMNDGRHLIFRDESGLKVSDLDFTNIYSLPESFAKSHVYAQSRSLYFIEERTIQAVTLP